MGDVTPSHTPPRISGTSPDVLANAKTEEMQRKAIGKGSAHDKPGARASSFGATEGKSNLSKVEKSNKPRDNMYTRLIGGLKRAANISVRLGMGAATGADVGDVFKDKNAQKGAKAEYQTGGDKPFGVKDGKIGPSTRAQSVGLSGDNPFGVKGGKIGPPTRPQAVGINYRKGKMKKNPNAEEDKKPGALKRIASGATGGGTGYTGGNFGVSSAYHGTTAAVSSTGYSGKSTGLGKSKGAQLVSRVGGPRKLGK